jgi:microcystin degradation protein MlrC
VERTVRGQLRPRMAVARRPMLLGLDLGRTLGEGPMVRLLRDARRLEQQEERIADISLLAGFPYGDVHEGGPSVVVVAHEDAPAARAAAERLMDEAERTRAESTVHLVPVAEAVERARQAASRGGPLILAEYTDGPGGGAYGDATEVLSALLAADLPGTVVGALYDPETARACMAAGVGRRGTFRVGGKTDARYGGGPVAVTGVVSAVSNGDYVRKGPFETGTRASLGPCACIDAGNVKVIVASYRVQAEDREQYRILGIEPETVNVLALKGINHFRADFEPIAREIVFVEAGGIAASDPSIFPWQQLRRPIWPLDAGA